MERSRATAIPETFGNWRIWSSAMIVLDDPFIARSLFRRNGGRVFTPCHPGASSGRGPSSRGRAAGVPAGRARGDRQDTDRTGWNGYGGEALRISYAPFLYKIKQPGRRPAAPGPFGL